MSPAQTQTMAPAQEAGRPQPQTTTQGQGHPFITYSQAGCRLQYTSTGNALGGQINQPLVAVPGYIRKFRVRVNASGGSATATAVITPDAPYSVFSNVQLYDSFGTPLIIGDGYSVTKLLPKYGGQHYTFLNSDPANSLSYVTASSGASATTGGGGNFTYQTALPLEFVKGIGCLSGANASLLPRLQWTLNSSGGIFSSATSAANIVTQPTVEVDVDSEFYWLPEGVNVEPPGLGSTCQWVLQQANPTIGSASTTRVQLPRFGGYITTLIMILRDANGVRTESWPTRMRVYVDGVPLWDIRDDELRDDMQNTFGLGQFNGTATSAGGTSPTWNAVSAAGAGGLAVYLTAPVIEVGVRVLSRKMSLCQNNLGLLDTGETFLSTSPGTLIEIEGAPWGTITTGPATLNVLVGLVVPTGTLVTGLPEM